MGRTKKGAVGCQCCLVVDGGIRAYVMPFFTHELEERTVSEGGTFSLIARVEAYPAVGVLWFVCMFSFSVSLLFFVVFSLFIYLFKKILRQKRRSEMVI